MTWLTRAWLRQWICPLRRSRPSTSFTRQGAALPLRNVQVTIALDVLNDQHFPLWMCKISRWFPTGFSRLIIWWMGGERKDRIGGERARWGESSGQTKGAIFRFWPKIWPKNIGERFRPKVERTERASFGQTCQKRPISAQFRPNLSAEIHRQSSLGLFWPKVILSVLSVFGRNWPS